MKKSMINTVLLLIFPVVNILFLWSIADPLRESVRGEWITEKFVTSCLIYVVIFLLFIYRFVYKRKNITLLGVLIGATELIFLTLPDFWQTVYRPIYIVMLEHYPYSFLWICLILSIYIFFFVLLVKEYKCLSSERIS